MFHLAALSALRCRKRSRAERIAASSFFWPAPGASVSTAFFSLTYLSSSGMLCQIRSRIHSPAAQAPPRLEHTQCSSGHVTTQAKTHRYTHTEKERDRDRNTPIRRGDPALVFPFPGLLSFLLRGVSAISTPLHLQLRRTRGACPSSLRHSLATLTLCTRALCTLPGILSVHRLCHCSPVRETPLFL